MGNLRVVDILMLAGLSLAVIGLSKITHHLLYRVHPQRFPVS